MRHKKTIVFRIVFTALTVLILAAIFIQSLMSADDSAQESGAVGKLIKALLEWLGLSGVVDAVPEGLLRKCAHFTEFFMLGASAFAMLYSYRKKIRFAVIGAPVIGAVAAVTDELIQLGSQGRSCEFRDMLIDTSGALTSALLMCLVFWLIKRKRTHETNR